MPLVTEFGKRIGEGEKTLIPRIKAIGNNPVIAWEPPWKK